MDQAQGSCLRVPKAPARYYDLPPPQLSRVMLWWSEAFWKVAAATKRQDCAEERWQEPPVSPSSAPLCAQGPLGGPWKCAHLTSPQSVRWAREVVTSLQNRGTSLPSDRLRGLRAGAHRRRERHHGRHQRLCAARAV